LFSTDTFSSQFNNTERLAEQGNALAQLKLGLKYEFGYRIRVDNAEAVKWYQEAASQGLSMAQFRLGCMYAEGEGVPENYTIAYMWLSMVKAQGHSGAADRLEILTSKMSKNQMADGNALVEKHQTPNFRVTRL
jgi:TPR repeat protein